MIQFSDALVPPASRYTEHFKAVDQALEWSKYGLELMENHKKEALKLLLGLKEDKSLGTYLEILKILKLFGSEEAVHRLCSEGYSRPALNDESGRLEKVLLFIQENYSRKISIAELAAQAHMSPSAFSHYFKKRTRKSFTDFVIEMRLGKAAQLLQLDEMPVTSVGYESGFSNVSHFNRSFNRKYKTTPLKFRKQS